MQKASNSTKLVQTGVFLAVLIALQSLSLPNLVTGVAVNAVFVFAVLRIQCGHALILAFLSPLGALISGHMLSYPMLPVIMLGNIILTLVYSALLKSGVFLRILLPALCKALFIWAAGMAVISYFNLNEAAKLIALSVIAIQFFAAVLGIFVGERLSRLVKAI